MKVALVQLNSSDDPVRNLDQTLSMVADSGDAELIVTPEVTNCVSSSRKHQMRVLDLEQTDKTLVALQKQALTLGKWILIGSLSLRTDDADGRFANRSFLIDPKGDVVARYDKCHMFDVVLSEQESYKESAGYRPGNQSVVCETPLGAIGMTVCYDVRFPYLYRSLAKAGAEIITVPSAFAPETGQAHWEVLLRARAIETGCFIIAPAQCGTHAATAGKPRKTYGHSLVIDPWGCKIFELGDQPGVGVVDLDLDLVRQARHRIPALEHDREIAVKTWKTQTKT